MVQRRASGQTIQSIVAIVCGAAFVAVPGFYWEFNVAGAVPEAKQASQSVIAEAEQNMAAQASAQTAAPPQASQQVASPSSPSTSLPAIPAQPPSASLPTQAKVPAASAPTQAQDPAASASLPPSQPTQAQVPAASAPLPPVSSSPPSPPPPLEQSNAEATLPPEPPAPEPGSYKSKVFAKGMECGDQALEIGDLPTVEACDKVVANKEECGRFFMFSKSHPDWKCRCCSPFNEDNGPGSPAWDVYRAQYPRSKSLPALPPTPPPINPFDGLPVSEKPRPSWLARQDELVVDGRPTEHGGIMILQAVLSDSHSTWGSKKVKKQGDRPDWLRAILATNRAHAEKHGHVMVLRAYPTDPQLPDWMIKECGKRSRQLCAKINERETYNWEKHLMMSDYLLSPQNFSHVLMLDADAALVQPQLDTLRRIAKILDDQKKSLFLTDEDWLDANGKGRINGGLMYAKNTEFTRGLFQDTFAAHWAGHKNLKKGLTGVQDLRCTSNEQVCLNDLYYGGNNKFILPHTIMATGKKYNRGAERGGEAHLTDASTEIMHWMGGAKGTAGKALCSGFGRDLTFGGPQGYGCKPR